MSSMKKLTISALCVALCVILPQVIPGQELRSLLSPMHLPVLLCGLVCGWSYGIACGAMGPALSSLITSMPPTAQLVPMIPELCAYGLMAGLLMQVIRTGKLYADLYLSLVPAMLVGRVVGGVARALFFMAQAKSYSIALWVGSYLTGTLPGIILQLVLLPILVVALTKAKLLPERYPAQAV